MFQDKNTKVKDYKKCKKKGKKNEKPEKELMIFETVDMVVSQSERKSLKIRKSVKMLRKSANKNRKDEVSKKNISKPMNVTLDDKQFLVNNEENKT